MNTPLRSVAPWARGRDVVLAAMSDLPPLTTALREAGHTVADVEGTPGMRTMQVRIAEALHLPATAGTNLDALVDSLRDLYRWWPGTRVLMLAWHDAHLLVEDDLPGWLELVDILRAASRQHLPGPPDGAGSLRFETLAGIRGHGVVPHSGEDRR